eukprot:s4714_g1.t3
MLPLQRIIVAFIPFYLTSATNAMEQDEQEDNAPVARGPPCRKSPLLAALNVSGTHGQMLVVYSGKGWDWSERKGKGGKGKHRRKEVKKNLGSWFEMFRQQILATSGAAWKAMALIVADVRCAPEVYGLRGYKPALSVSQLGVPQLAVPGAASSRTLGGLCLGVFASAALRTSHRRRNCRRDRTQSMALEAEDGSGEAANCGICGIFGGERRGMLQAGLLLTLPSPSAAEQLQIQDSVNCINCNGEGYLTCFRCKGTKKMRWLEEQTPEAELKDCIECDATGYVPCGRCQATGLSATRLKSYNRDEKFRKIVARTRKIKCDDDGSLPRALCRKHSTVVCATAAFSESAALVKDGPCSIISTSRGHLEAKLKRVMATAIAEVEAKTAVSEGREAQEVTFLSDMWRYHLETNQWFPIRYDDGPLGRWKEGATPVYNNSELVLMGGCTETSVKFSRNDLWVFTPVRGGGSWRRVHTSNPPVARRGHVLVANHSHLIMFGGKTTHRREERAVEEMEEGIPDLDYTPQPGEKCLVDLWVISKDEVLKGSSTKEPPRWQEGAPFPAGCRWGGTGSFLRDYLGKKYLAMFGGRHLSAGSVEHQASSKYVYYNDLWLYDFMQDGWYQAPTKGARPCPRDHHGAATLDNKLYIYGGRRSEERSGHAVLADVWSYDINTLTWTEHVPLGTAPTARFMPGVSDILYHGKQHLAVFAGETLPGSTKRTTLNDLWVFDPSSAVWTELFAPTCEEKPDPEEYISWSTEIGCLALVFCFGPALYLGIKQLVRPARAREMSQPFLT